MVPSFLLIGALLAPVSLPPTAPAAMPQASPETQGDASARPRLDAVNTRLDEIGWSVVAGVESLSREVVGHARRTAADPRLAQMIAQGDSRGVSGFASRIISSSTMVEELCVFNLQGELVGFDDDEDQGGVFDGPRLRAMVADSKGDRDVLRSVLSPPHGRDALQFLAGEPSTSRVGGSTGTAIVYTTPVRDTDSKVVGALKVRVGLQRLLNRIDAPGFLHSGGQVWFVGDDGRAIDIQSRDEQMSPPVPAEQLARLVGAIDWGQTPSFRYSRGGEILSLYSIPRVKTVEHGGLHVLLSAPQEWLEQEMLAQVAEARTLRSRTYASYTIAALLALVALMGFQARRKLLMAYERADRASHSKSAFLANTSHEIRTPMTAILGYAELLGGKGQSEPSDELRSEAVTAIQQHGKHLLTLIGDVLDLSKIEAGAIEIERLPADPAQIAHEAATLLRERAEDKGLSLNVRVGSEVPQWASIDPTRTRQVLLNLIGNAIKFTEKGAVTVHVESVRGAGAQRLAFVVEDTGIGMSTTAAATIFEAYVQAESSTTRRFGGTGLGLAISKQLTELMGGTIECTSRLGEGTKFRFTMLAPSALAPAEGEPPAPLPASSQESTAATNAPEGRTKRATARRGSCSRTTARPTVASSASS